MRILKNLITRLFKPKRDNEPWLKFYSREERSIEFTTKSIYNYMKDEVGEDKDFIALNYFGNRKYFYTNTNIELQTL